MGCTLPIHQRRHASRPRINPHGAQKYPMRRSNEGNCGSQTSTREQDDSDTHHPLPYRPRHRGKHPRRLWTIVPGRSGRNERPFGQRKDQIQRDGGRIGSPATGNVHRQPQPQQETSANQRIIPRMDEEGNQQAEDNKTSHELPRGKVRLLRETWIGMGWDTRDESQEQRNRRLSYSTANRTRRLRGIPSSVPPRHNCVLRM
jgi:hypothetical protein